MSDEHVRVIEIGGVKVEVDMRSAKRIESYKVGDPVKVLRKSYADSWNVCPGVIVGFCDFKKRPTIEVLVVASAYGTANIEIVAISAETQDTEIAPFGDYEIAFTKATIFEKLDAEIATHREQIRLIETRRAAFDRYFGKFMPDTPE